MDTQQIIEWLLKGDVSIQYQTHRDLLDIERKDLQARIGKEGWGKQFLLQRKANGNWGDRFYQPKWTSTHYTLLDLRNLNLDPDHKMVQQSIEQVLDNSKAEDGGIRLGPSTSRRSDVCVNGMFLNYASYFRTSEVELSSVVDCILNEKMPDGGFNCWSAKKGATHSSLHSTLSVIEGLSEYLQAGHSYQKKKVSEAIRSAEEFILMHRLFRSDRTGKIINEDFLKLSYPGRWRYDILRALDYFRKSGGAWDPRMQDAVAVIFKKRNKDGTWNLQAAHPGKVHFEMEKAGQPSRWNTLRALRVLKHFKRDN